jgi:hypothetical protein
MRVLSILGFIFTTMFLIWLVIAAMSNGRIDLEEFAPVGFLYGLFMIPVTLVGMILGGRRKR